MADIKNKLSLPVTQATNYQSIVYLAMTVGVSFPPETLKWYMPFCLTILAVLSYLTKGSDREQPDSGKSIKDVLAEGRDESN